MASTRQRRNVSNKRSVSSNLAIRRNVMRSKQLFDKQMLRSKLISMGFDRVGSTSGSPASSESGSSVENHCLPLLNGRVASPANIPLSRNKDTLPLDDEQVLKSKKEVAQISTTNLLMGKRKSCSGSTCETVPRTKIISNGLREERKVDKAFQTIRNDAEHVSKDEQVPTMLWSDVVGSKDKQSDPRIQSVKRNPTKSGGSEFGLKRHRSEVTVTAARFTREKRRSLTEAEALAPDITLPAREPPLEVRKERKRRGSFTAGQSGITKPQNSSEKNIAPELVPTSGGEVNGYVGERAFSARCGPACPCQEMALKSAPRCADTAACAACSPWSPSSCQALAAHFVEAPSCHLLPVVRLRGLSARDLVRSLLVGAASPPLPESNTMEEPDGRPPEEVRGRKPTIVKNDKVQSAEASTGINSTAELRRKAVSLPAIEPFIENSSVEDVGRVHFNSAASDALDKLMYVNIETSSSKSDIQESSCLKSPRTGQTRKLQKDIIRRMRRKIHTSITKATEDAAVGRYASAEQLTRSPPSSDSPQLKDSGLGVESGDAGLSQPQVTQETDGALVPSCGGTNIDTLRTTEDSLENGSLAIDVVRLTDRKDSVERERVAISSPRTMKNSCLQTNQLLGNASLTVASSAIGIEMSTERRGSDSVLVDVRESNEVSLGPGAGGISSSYSDVQSPIPSEKRTASESEILPRSEIRVAKCDQTKDSSNSVQGLNEDLAETQLPLTGQFSEVGLADKGDTRPVSHSAHSKAKIKRRPRSRQGIRVRGLRTFFLVITRCRHTRFNNSPIVCEFSFGPSRHESGSKKCSGYIVRPRRRRSIAKGRRQLQTSVENLDDEYSFDTSPEPPPARFPCVSRLRPGVDTHGLRYRRKRSKQSPSSSCALCHACRSKSRSSSRTPSRVSVPCSGCLRAKASLRALGRSKARRQSEEASTTLTARKRGPQRRVEASRAVSPSTNGNAEHHHAHEPVRSPSEGCAVATWGSSVALSISASSPAEQEDEEDDFSCVWCGLQCISSQELDVHAVSHAEPPDNSDEVEEPACAAGDAFPSMMPVEESHVEESFEQPLRASNQELSDEPAVEPVHESVGELCMDKGKQDSAAFAVDTKPPVLAESIAAVRQPAQTSRSQTCFLVPDLSLATLRRIACDIAVCTSSQIDAPLNIRFVRTPLVRGKPDADTAIKSEANSRSDTVTNAIPADQGALLNGFLPDRRQSVIRSPRVRADVVTAAVDAVMPPVDVIAPLVDVVAPLVNIVNVQSSVDVITPSVHVVTPPLDETPSANVVLTSADVVTSCVNVVTPSDEEVAPSGNANQVGKSSIAVPNRHVQGLDRSKSSTSWEGSAGGLPPVDTAIAHHSSETLQPDTSLPCTDCSLTFPTASARREHQVAWHAQERMRVCGLCGYASASKQRAEEHAVLAHFVPRLPCSLCPKKFSSKALLELHQATAHPALKTVLTCPVCNVIWKNATVLTQHLRVVHPGVRPFLCFCGAWFDCVSQLKKHHAAHETAIFKLHCPVCFSWFPTKKLLCSHMTDAHDAPKPLSCPDCVASYKTLHSLTRHITVGHRQRERYQCNCNEFFENPLAFYRHICSTGHSLERSSPLFKCGSCDLTSYDRLQIHEHQDTEHSGRLSLSRIVSLFTFMHEVTAKL